MIESIKEQIEDKKNYIDDLVLDIDNLEKEIEDARNKIAQTEEEIDKLQIVLFELLDNR